MSSEPGKHAAGAFAAVAAATALMAIAYTKPPLSLCEPPVGLAHAAIGVAQALVFGAFALLRKGSPRGLALGAVGAAWAAVSAGVLIMRICAGQAATAGAVDVAFGALGGAALAMLAGGLSASVRGGGRTAAYAVLVAAAGIAATKLADGRAADRVWTTWGRMQAATAALETARGPGSVMPPGESADFGEVAAALPAEAMQGVVTTDAWGRPLRYSSSGPSWTLVSLGADGAEGPYSEGPSRDFADDLVVKDGAPVAWPESPCAPGPRPPPLPPGVKDLRERRLP